MELIEFKGCHARDNVTNNLEIKKYVYEEMPLKSKIVVRTETPKSCARST